MKDASPSICGFRTVRLLGRGGMSEVWEMENLRLGSRHAVKIFAYGGDDAEVLARFVQEGRLLAHLRHPRIVAVSDVGTTDGGRPFFVMDLVLNPDGHPQTLADVPDGAADEETVARWYDDIREGLGYIHARGIVHRDLKFQNVMVGPDGHAVLTDFGISRITAGSDGTRPVASPVTTLVRTRDGRRPIMGSVGYMAPELELGCAATPQSDWYALGVMVYRLLSGSWCDARTDLSATLGSFDPAWAGIVPKLLHANPAGRECPSFAESRAALLAAEAVECEKRQDRLDARVKRLGLVACVTGALAALLAIVSFAGVIRYRTERQAWHLRLVRTQTRADIPLFDELFTIPAAAKADETTDEDGNEIPARSQFAASRVDALVLTRPLLSDLANGRITPEECAEKMEEWADDLQDDSVHSPLDDLEFGGTSYLQMGDNVSLRQLLLKAAETLSERSGE